jgi:predicted ATPase/DNA-binding XRE family transcriptional regulator
MKPGEPETFGTQLKALREAAGFTQEELATIAGLSVQAIGALERGERRRPRLQTVRALSAALDLPGPTRDALIGSARAPVPEAAADELGGVALACPPTILLGREADVQTLSRWLTDPAARLITLIGPGGVGKTRLALEVARATGEGGAMRVVFLALASVRVSTFVASAIAEALGLPDATAADLPARAATTFDRPTLLVLDSCEHVLDAAAPLVADLLASTALLRLLATSRAPLRVRGEREFSVGPLAIETGTDAIAYTSLARSPAVRLFVERVRDVRPDFRLTSANASTVAAICRRLDALPLALELAAPWLKVLTPEDLRERLERDVLLSSVGTRDLPERQQTMNATVAWSYQLLDPRAQRAFRRLGALHGRFSLTAAAAVLAEKDSPVETDDALDAVAGLIDKSLLSRAESSLSARPLYEMLETVRAYAALELNAADERDDTVEGLARYCISEAALVEEGLIGPAQDSWLDRVRDDLESYRAGLTWLIERGRATEAAAIALGLLFFWMIRGHATEGLQWYEKILSLPLAPAARSRVLTAAAMLWYTQGALGRARTALDTARAAAGEAGDRQAAVQAEWALGHIENAVGNLDAARELFTRSSAGFDASGNRWGAGNALSGLAWVALGAGDTAQADRLLGDAASVLQRSGSWFMLVVLYLRAILAVRLGNPDEAIRWVRESLVRIRHLRDKFAFVYMLVPLAAAAVLKGDEAWAARILGARDAATERSGAIIADHSVQDLRQLAEREAPIRLGPERWARAYAAGRNASIDLLLKDIDRRSSTTARAM